jgi:hypothetical protein
VGVTEDQIDLLLALARKYQSDGQRRGQALVNATYGITGLTPPEEADPFYDDRLTLKFWEWLTEQVQ